MDIQPAYEPVYCQQCNLAWSGNPADYPHLREEEYLLCVCGTPLIRKEELREEETSVIQPATSFSGWL